jgi:hypothetical protein
MLPLLTKLQDLRLLPQSPCFPLLAIPQLLQAHFQQTHRQSPHIRATVALWALALVTAFRLIGDGGQLRAVLDVNNIIDITMHNK